ncbi:GntR family transcriptional regulator [Devosia geojensis]|uniref:GntR family transcriptional regulator n=1 Tax=Devosia geojensis TaxID=443610 RepID=A0A0F5FDT0_9HYPH|nr:FadR/GntR family transcriptional regulator [Devosia geojensis]KKB06730.1 GntR family transcriptional regulator [Devosia geojensis]
MELRRGNLAEQIVEVMRRRIQDGEYALGSKLPTEQELIGEFGVSRTVIREAIANLKAGSMVTTRQGVGVFVQSASLPQGFVITPKDIDALSDKIALLDLRIALEVEGAGLAAARRSDQALANIERSLEVMREAIAAGSDAIEADLDFHRSVAAATNNVHFSNLFGYIGTLSVPRARFKTYGLSQDERIAYLNKVNEEHAAVFLAIQAGDSENARSAMRLHLVNSKQRLMRELESGKTGDEGSRASASSR